jgi:hypothetical protein
LPLQARLWRHRQFFWEERVAFSIGPWDLQTGYVERKSFQKHGQGHFHRKIHRSPQVSHPFIAGLSGWSRRFCFWDVLTIVIRLFHLSRLFLAMPGGWLESG